MTNHSNSVKDLNQKEPMEDRKDALSAAMTMTKYWEDLRAEAAKHGMTLSEFQQRQRRLKLKQQRKNPSEAGAAGSQPTGLPIDPRQP